MGGVRGISTQSKADSKNSSGLANAAQPVALVVSDQVDDDEFLKGRIHFRLPGFSVSFMVSGFRCKKNSS